MLRSLLALTVLTIGATVGGDVAPDGNPSQAFLPADQRLHNTGGLNGAGLCVFTSIEHAARCQNVFQLMGFQQWMTHKPGGGWPEKVDKMVAEYCKFRNMPIPVYLQVTNGDLGLLERACRSGRMPGVTYSFSPSGRYGGRRIAHMVNLVSAGSYWGILDNNYEKSIEWLSKEEFTKTFGGKDGWAVILLSPATPINPHN